MPVREDWETVSDDLTSQIDGNVTDFTTSERFRPGTVRGRLNGMEVEPVVAFQEVAEKTVRFLPFTLRPPDQFIVRYVPY